MSAVCAGCGRAFESVGGVPVLFPRGTHDTRAAGDAFFLESPGRLLALSRRHPRLARLIAFPSFLAPTRALPRSREWFAHHVQAGVAGETVLNLGAGVHKLYANPHLLNFDIAPHENAHVAGDGAALPFRDGVFDGVLLDAVIEHLPDPESVVREVRRVLKPGGVVLAHVPFLYPYHAVPHDYRRYTPSGLATLFGEFDILECGTDRRPGRALLEVLTAYAGIFADGRTLSYALRWMTAWVFLPLKYLDAYLSRKAKADDVAAGSTVLAAKPLHG